MKIILTSVILASTLAAGASPTLAKLGGPGSTLDISFKKFVLKNGLTLIVHEDHKAPIVAVSSTVEAMRPRIATGEMSIEGAGWELFRLILDVASGRTQVWSDRWGIHNDLTLFNPAPVT